MVFTAMAALREAGLEVIDGPALRSPAGAGGAPPDGTRWAVRDSAGVGWTATLLAPADDDGVRLRERAARLAAVDHPHLAPVRPPVVLSDGGAVVLERQVPGTDLRTIGAGRGRWSPGEVVTVVVPLAEALAALHAADLAHGDVAPATVVLDPAGRPVLVGTIWRDGPGTVGTPGFAAPERPDGAGPAGDVHALGRVGLHLLGGGDEVGGVDGAGAGDRLRQHLVRAVNPDPHQRPTAAHLAWEVYAACVPEPVRNTERLPVRARGRHRRPRRYRAALVGVAVVALSLSATVVGAVARGGAAAEQSPGAGRDVPVATAQGTDAGAGQDVPVATALGSDEVAGLGVDPVAAAVRLTLARAKALATGDDRLLAHVTLPGSRAASADARAMAARRGREPLGAVTAVVDRVAHQGVRSCVAGLGSGPRGENAATLSGVGERCVRVLLVARIGALDRLGADGPPVEGTAAESPPESAESGPLPPPRGVVLVLRPTADGWRVSEVEPADW